MAMVGIKTPDWVSNLANSLAEMSRELLERSLSNGASAANPQRRKAERVG